MPELLLEVGTEELPASFVRKAYHDLRDAVVGLLQGAGLGHGEVLAMGTPRRLIVSVQSVEARQADTTKEQRGPALKAAFDADGNPTPALLGFCRSQGVDVATIRRDEQYVWITKTIVGLPALEVLSAELPKVIRGLSFDKSMRWGASRIRFARPLRWLLASFGGDVVPFEIEGVAAALESRGHRFYAPEAFTATTCEELLVGLRARNVEPDPEQRSALIRKGANEVATGEAVITESLLEENTFLTEWPTSIAGHFLPDFMQLPDPVLITAMAKHEKMFPVRNSEGALTNQFVFVRNSGEDDTVRSGCEWVLNARFNDAKFFYEEDRKYTLDQFLEKTSTIVFQEKLGSVRLRADRLMSLAEKVAKATGASDEEASLAVLAAKYAKADLATGLVSELSSLQGVIGGEYAKREGMPSEVVFAIASQYDASKVAAIATAEERTAARLILTDAIDKLAGYLGLGLEPSGSSDPFALRRAATQVIEIAWSWPTAFPSVLGLIQDACAAYGEIDGIEYDGAPVPNALNRIFSARYEALLTSVRHDILEAALLPTIPYAALDPQGVQARISLLQALVSDTEFVQVATRPLNLVASARKNGVEFAETSPLEAVVPANLQSPEGEALLETLKTFDSSQLESSLRGLVAPINRFFDGAMMMDQNPDVRFARLSLLNACAEKFLRAGDFSRIVVAG